MVNLTTVMVIGVAILAALNLSMRLVSDSIIQRKIQMLQFIIIMSSLMIALFRYYVWRRLVEHSNLPEFWKRVNGRFLLSVIGFAMFGSLSRVIRLPNSETLLYLAFICYGFYGMLVGFLLISEIVLLTLRLVLNGLSFSSANKPASTTWTDKKNDDALPAAHDSKAKIRAVVVLLSTIIGSIYALYCASLPPITVTIRVHLPGMPASLSGYRLVQISDVHIGPTVGKHQVETIVKMANDNKPDAIMLTGDFLDGDVTMESVRDAATPLGDLKAKDGIYYVTGNHEYQHPYEESIKLLESFGIRVLRNERILFPPGHAETFDLAGVDDWTAARWSLDHKADLPKALRGRDPNRALMLLAHQPAQYPEAAKAGVGVMLSGHTHGGQIAPGNFFAWLLNPKFAGLYTPSKDGGTTIYVSRGSAYWGPPMRLFAPHEITVITLLANIEDL